MTGRPIKKNKRLHTVGIRLDDKLYNALEEKRGEIALSTYIRQLIYKDITK